MEIRFQIVRFDVTVLTQTVRYSMYTLVHL